MVDDKVVAKPIDSMDVNYDMVQDMYLVQINFKNPDSTVNIAMHETDMLRTITIFSTVMNSVITERAGLK
jgi:hypothetical protein